MKLALILLTYFSHVLWKVTSRRSGVVIGAGVGGLVTATRLAQEGFSITLIERNGSPGGRMSSERIEGYRFDIGPSLLLLPSVYYKTFQLLGTSSLFFM